MGQCHCDSGDAVRNISRRILSHEYGLRSEESSPPKYHPQFAEDVIEDRHLAFCANMWPIDRRHPGALRSGIIAIPRVRFTAELSQTPLHTHIYILPVSLSSTSFP
jgi:hypothetical protein